MKIQFDVRTATVLVILYPIWEHPTSIEVAIKFNLKFKRMHIECLYLVPDFNITYIGVPKFILKLLSRVQRKTKVLIAM